MLGMMVTRSVGPRSSTEGSFSIVYGLARLLAGRPAILYKSLPSLILPAGDGDQHRAGGGSGRHPALEPPVAAAAVPPAAEGPAGAVIPLKETLARRLSASMDCIDAAGVDDGKLAKDAAAAAAAAGNATTTTSESQLGADVDEPQTPPHCQ